MKKKGLAAFFLGWVLSTAVDAELTPMKVALDWYINPDQAPLLVADAEGFFKDEGIELTLLTPTDVNEPLQMLAMGKVDISTTYAPHLIVESSKGVPLMWVATSVRQPLDCLTVLKSSGIKTPLDLKGKTIGYSSGAFGNSMLKGILASAGLSLSDVKLVNIKMNLIQSLLSGRVDAVAGMMRSVEPIQIESMGYPVTMFFPEAYGTPSYEELIFIGNRDAMEKNPHLYDHFVKALTRGVQFLKAHPEESWEDVIKKFPDELAPAMTTAKINHQLWKASIPYFTENPGVLDRSSYERLAKFLIAQGLIVSAPPEKNYLRSSL